MVDTYTKAVLTVIALALTLMVAEPLYAPRPAQADGSKIERYLKEIQDDVDAIEWLQRVRRFAEKLELPVSEPEPWVRSTPGSGGSVRAVVETKVLVAHEVDRLGRRRRPVAAPRRC